MWAALRSRGTVKGHYHGLPRIFRAHKIGFKRNNLRVLACQHGGETSRGPVRPDAPEWKCLEVALLENLQAAPGDWYPQGTADPDAPRSTCMDPERTKVVAHGDGTLEGAGAVRHELRREQERIRRRGRTGEPQAQDTYEREPW